MYRLRQKQPSIIREIVSFQIDSMNFCEYKPSSITCVIHFCINCKVGLSSIVLQTSVASIEQATHERKLVIPSREIYRRGLAAVDKGLTVGVRRLFHGTCRRTRLMLWAAIVPKLSKLPIPTSTKPS